MKKTKRILVAMSGGVDSSVVAALLKEQGHDIIGVTLHLWDSSRQVQSVSSKRCCSFNDIEDAQSVAHRLGIPHYILNYEKEFQENIVDYFANEYHQGRTPNPCIMCNSELKFHHLIKRMSVFSADYLATGHYARLIRREGRIILSQSHDKTKDQSYFLFNVAQQVFKKCLFPLENLTKQEVRKIAEKYQLSTAQKAESQEICFVGGGRYTEFLDRYYSQYPKKQGSFITQDGKSLGRHKGIHYYTVGQRKRLGLSNINERHYVKKIDVYSGNVVLSQQKDLYVHEFFVKTLNWLIIPPKEGEEISSQVMIRYRGLKVKCRLIIYKESCHVCLERPMCWVSPGQAAVFYLEEQVIGGGFIASVGDEVVSV